MTNGMSPDRQEKHDTLLGFEEKLTNGHRGDLNTMSDHLVALSRAFRVVLSTDFVKPSELKSKFGWPAASSVGFITCAVVGLILRFAG